MTMTDDDIANKFIDRSAEQELFEQMLQLQDDARLLVITDRGDRGKSTLLQRLKYICDWTSAPAVPVSLVPLDQLAAPDPYELVKQVRRDLQLPFAGFDQMADAVLSKDPSVFLNSKGGYGGSVDARDASVTGGVVAGIYLNAPLATTVTLERREWNAQIEERAREQAVKTFFDELRAICAERLVVLLFDSFDEKSNGALRDWTLRRLVRGLCLDEGARADKLVLVLAGRTKPAFTGIAGYQGRFKSIDSLGLWEEKHLRDFLKLHGVGQLLEEDFNFVYKKLRQGLGLNRALDLANGLTELE